MKIATNLYQKDAEGVPSILDIEKSAAPERLEKVYETVEGVYDAHVYKKLKAKDNTFYSREDNGREVTNSHANADPFKPLVNSKVAIPKTNTDQKEPVNTKNGLKFNTLNGSEKVSGKKDNNGKTFLGNRNSNSTAYTIQDVNSIEAKSGQTVINESNFRTHNVQSEEDANKKLANYKHRFGPAGFNQEEYVNGLKADGYGKDNKIKTQEKYKTEKTLDNVPNSVSGITNFRPRSKDTDVSVTPTPAGTYTNSNATYKDNELNVNYGAKGPKENKPDLLKTAGERYNYKKEEKDTIEFKKQGKTKTTKFADNNPRVEIINGASKEHYETLDISADDASILERNTLAVNAIDNITKEQNKGLNAEKKAQIKARQYITAEPKPGQENPEYGEYGAEIVINKHEIENVNFYAKNNDMIKSNVDGFKGTMQIDFNTQDENPESIKFDGSDNSTAFKQLGINTLKTLNLGNAADVYNDTVGLIGTLTGNGPDTSNQLTNSMLALQKWKGDKFKTFHTNDWQRSPYYKPTNINDATMRGELGKYTRLVQPALKENENNTFSDYLKAGSKAALTNTLAVMTNNTAVREVLDAVKGIDAELEPDIDETINMYTTSADTMYTTKPGTRFKALKNVSEAMVSRNKKKYRGDGETNINYFGQKESTYIAIKDNDGKVTWNKGASLFTNYNKSAEETLFINALKDKNTYNQKLGYIHIKPTILYNGSGSAAETILDIPFEFNPEISETPMQANYATETLMNRIGQFHVYTGTNLSQLNISLTYIALTPDELDAEMMKTASKQYSTDVWQYYWTNNRIEQIELMLRSLVLPDVTSETYLIKPPIIEVHLENPNGAGYSSVGDLYKYPIGIDTTDNKKSSKTNGQVGDKYLKVSRDLKGDDYSRYKKYIVNSVQIDKLNDDSFYYPSLYGRVVSDYSQQGMKLVNTIKTGKDLGRTGDSSLYGYSGYTRRTGFKATIQCTEVTENFLDIVPDFRAYYDAWHYKGEIANVTSEYASIMLNSEIRQTVDDLNTNLYSSIANISSLNDRLMALFEEARILAAWYYKANFEEGSKLYQFNQAANKKATDKGVTYESLGYFSFAGCRDDKLINKDWEYIQSVLKKEEAAAGLQPSNIKTINTEETVKSTFLNNGNSTITTQITTEELQDTDCLIPIILSHEFQNKTLKNVLSGPEEIYANEDYNKTNVFKLEDGDSMVKDILHYGEKNYFGGLNRVLVKEGNEPSIATDAAVIATIISNYQTAAEYQGIAMDASSRAAISDGYEKDFLNTVLTTSLNLNANANFKEDTIYKDMKKYFSEQYHDNYLKGCPAPAYIKQLIEVNCSKILDKAETLKDKYDEIASNIEAIPGTYADEHGREYSINYGELIPTRLEELFKIINGIFSINKDGETPIYYCTNSSGEPVNARAEIRTSSSKFYNIRHLAGSYIYGKIKNDAEKINLYDIISKDLESEFKRLAANVKEYNDAKKAQNKEIKAAGGVPEPFVEIKLDDLSSLISEAKSTIKKFIDTSSSYMLQIKKIFDTVIASQNSAYSAVAACATSISNALLSGEKIKKISSKTKKLKWPVANGVSSAASVAGIPMVDFKSGKDITPEVKIYNCTQDFKYNIVDNNYLLDHLEKGYNKVKQDIEELNQEMSGTGGSETLNAEAVLNDSLVSQDEIDNYISKLKQNTEELGKAMQTQIKFISNFYNSMSDKDVDANTANESATGYENAVKNSISTITAEINRYYDNMQSVFAMRKKFAYCIRLFKSLVSSEALQKNFESLASNDSSESELKIEGLSVKTLKDMAKSYKNKSNNKYELQKPFETWVDNLKTEEQWEKLFGASEDNKNAAPKIPYMYYLIHKSQVLASKMQVASKSINDGGVGKLVS